VVGIATRLELVVAGALVWWALRQGGGLLAPVDGRLLEMDALVGLYLPRLVRRLRISVRRRPRLEWTLGILLAFLLVLIFCGGSSALAANG
jgi:hypothetical protein